MTASTKNDASYNARPAEAEALQAGVEAVLYARFDPAWGRMMLCERDQFGAVEYRAASLSSAPAQEDGSKEEESALVGYDQPPGYGDISHVANL